MLAAVRVPGGKAAAEVEVRGIVPRGESLTPLAAYCAELTDGIVGAGRR